MQYCKLYLYFLGVKNHLIVRDPEEKVVNLIGGYRVGVPQLLGELVDAPQQEDGPQSQQPQDDGGGQQYCRPEVGQERLLETEWSTLIGPDPSRYSALIG